MNPDPPEADEPRADPDEPPPLMGTWPRLYAFVVASQVVLVGVFYVLTRLYAP